MMRETTPAQTSHLSHVTGMRQAHRSIRGLATLVVITAGHMLPAVALSEAWDETVLGTPARMDDFLSDTTPDGELSQDAFERLRRRGEHLFVAPFTTLDGAGRPMATQAIVPTKRRRAARQMFSRTAGLDANACASCHHQPILGGAGDFTSNVFVSEGFQHTDFDTTDPQFSNERNTNHLFGAGLVELLAREMSRDLQIQRTDALTEARRSGQAVRVALQTKQVSFGFLTANPDGLVAADEIDGVDDDLIVRPFSHKGVMTSLRQFTINALNHHHGMQASERFGARWTGEPDFDEDGVPNEVSAGDVSALVAWQASLPPPTLRSDLPENWVAAADRGREQFDALGCQACHRASLPLEDTRFMDPGPLDAAGTLRTDETGAARNLIYDLASVPGVAALPRDAEGRILVPLFGDLKRHVIADNQINTLGNELLSQRFVERNRFMTTELWGVASTAPYGHRGDLTTLTEVIDAHGGAARAARDAWKNAGDQVRSDVLAFLKSMVIAP